MWKGIAALVLVVAIVVVLLQGSETMNTAPEFVGIKEWINSKPLTLKELRGKVVLVDFWTYSCINCIRTLPYLKAWHEKYGKSGLVIIGVHTPEFNFEKQRANVEKAVKDFGINYPVALDNDYETWNAYHNHYWPRKYLIDKNGVIRHDHAGEGGYEETEKVIVELLAEIGETVKTGVNVTAEKPSFFTTPELYAGFQFARQPLGNPEGFSPGSTVFYKSLSDFEPDTIYAEGNWTNNPDSLKHAGKDGAIILHYTAAAVNIVASAAKETTVEVTLDSKPLPKELAGADVKFSEGNAHVNVKEARLYKIVAGTYGKHLLRLETNGPLELFTFTFG